ncbi:hypothetical protein L6452_06073 [Arctium lappa]|uniref:Uncharacterized protein n=1 Tax=Arctium lappa TaxID=4217 RepID=A0ACB9EIV1_ARCLA|nr:hypothetical protein L6452_06073 [Arctium lappa]
MRIRTADGDDDNEVSQFFEKLSEKMDLQGIAEATGVCLGAVVCVAAFAWFSSARNRVGQGFSIGCNTFIDSLIDQVIDGLFYETDLSDWTDDS